MLCSRGRRCICDRAGNPQERLHAFTLNLCRAVDVVLASSRCSKRAYCAPRIPGRTDERCEVQKGIMVIGGIVSIYCSHGQVPHRLLSASLPCHIQPEHAPQHPDYVGVDQYLWVVSGEACNGSGDVIAHTRQLLQLIPGIGQDVAVSLEPLVEKGNHAVGTPRQSERIEETSYFLRIRTRRLFQCRINSKETLKDCHN